MQYGNVGMSESDEHATEFKSYYVVWKPTHLMTSKGCLIGLNRTMQYGNGGLTEDEINKEIV